MSISLTVVWLFWAMSAHAAKGEIAVCKTLLDRVSVLNLLLRPFDYFYVINKKIETIDDIYVKPEDRQELLIQSYPILDFIRRASKARQNITIIATSDEEAQRLKLSIEFSFGRLRTQTIKSSANAIDRSFEFEDFQTGNGPKVLIVVQDVPSVKLKPSVGRPKNPKDKYYATVEEAMAAAKALGIVKTSQYRMFHYLDPKLPPDPSYTYGESFKGFTVFFYKNK